MHTLTTSCGQTLLYVGPDLSHGPLPAVIYFALSAKESLLTDPFNQMVVKLQKFPMRIFSIDLPAHGESLAATDALKVWAGQVEAGQDPLTPFLDKAASSLEFLLEQGYITKEATAVAGLSRGAFVATQVAARLSWLHFILGFAPLTHLSYAKEFQHLKNHEIVYSLQLPAQIPHLLHKTLRFYISNRDARVGTKECFEFIRELADKAHEARVRAPQIELFLKPPLGHQGHGTSQEVFEEGADWLLEKLRISHGT